MLRAAREELAEGGYSTLSSSAVASRAGVDRTTVHRRWPTKARLAGDAVLDLAQTEVPVPVADEPEKALRLFMEEVANLLADPATIRVLAALTAARAEDPELEELNAAFWKTRFAGAGPLIRALTDAELSSSEVDDAIELLVAPLYFRAIILGKPVDSQLIDRGVRLAISSLRR